jgi:hypothetical protein
LGLSVQTLKTTDLSFAVNRNKTLEFKLLSTLTG